MDHEFTLVISNAGCRVEVASGQSIGHKRIITIDEPARVRSAMIKVYGPSKVAIKDFAAFEASGCTLPPSPPAISCDIVQNFQYQGAALETPHSAGTVDACCAACRSLPSTCVAFTFTREVADGATCQLLKALGGGLQMDGVVSGTPNR